MLNLVLLLQDTPDTSAIQHMALTMMAILPFFILIGLAVVILPIWFICKKAGFSPWLSLLAFIPFGILILLYVLAFAEWKVVPAPQAYFPPQPSVPPPTFPPQS
jgi:energy-coupling factor transporter transmembrane protein EcfT